MKLILCKKCGHRDLFHGDLRYAIQWSRATGALLGKKCHRFDQKGNTPCDCPGYEEP